MSLQERLAAGIPAFAPALDLLVKVTLKHHEREFFIDNLLVRIHFIIVMNRWTGLAPCEFGFPSPGSRTSTVLERAFPRSRRPWTSS